MKTADIERAVVIKMFPPTRYITIPNVSWSFFVWHESDLIALSDAGYAYEVEIKRTKSDLIADKKKQRWSLPSYRNKRIPLSNLIKSMWFAGPQEMESDLLEHAQPFAGVITVEEKEPTWQNPLDGVKIYRCHIIRKPKVNPDHIKWDAEKRNQLLRLAYLRFTEQRWNIRSRQC